MSRRLICFGLCLSLAGSPVAGCGDDDGGGNNNNSDAVCGNGRAEGAESCDGSDLKGQTCASTGHFAGTLSCTPNCNLDMSLCEPDYCGNGVAGPAEECDGVDLGFATCQAEGFAGGDIACDASCALDVSGCLNVYCGSGAIEGGEVCDGNDLDGETCQSQGYDMGTLACLPSCAGFDILGCYDATCGDDTIQGNEDCDGANLGGASCQSLGYDGGTLVCTNCHHDTAGCWTQVCGDDAVQPGEVCDGPDLAGEDCLTQGFDGGTLVCLGDCSGYDTAGCLTQGTGESCTDLYTVQTYPHHVSGANLTADYDNDHNFTGAGCGTGNGVEAVFAVDLQAGDRIKLDETGGLDAVIRVLDTCDATAACLLSSDSPETSLFFTAPATGTYYVVLEDYYSSPANTDYDFTITWVPPEDCGDGVDNDLDGHVDCGDPDCFGDPTHCATEALCTDGLDNDNDGNTDCADTDCSVLPICGGGTVVFTESFDASAMPHAGWTLEDGQSDGATWQSCVGCAGVGSTGGAVTLANASGGYIYVDDDTNNDIDIEGLISPSFDCSGTTNVVLSFVHYYKALSPTSGTVEISNDGGNNFVPVATYAGNSSGNGDTVLLDISSEAAGQSDVRIRFVYDGTGAWAWYWLIDTVEVRAL